MADVEMSMVVDPSKVKIGDLLQKYAVLMPQETDGSFVLKPHQFALGLTRALEDARRRLSHWIDAPIASVQSFALSRPLSQYSLGYKRLQKFPTDGWAEIDIRIEVIERCEFDSAVLFNLNMNDPPKRLSPSGSYSPKRLKYRSRHQGLQRNQDEVQLRRDCVPPEYSRLIF